MDCSEAIYSEDYYDLLLEYGGNVRPTVELACLFGLSSRFQAGYLAREGLPPLNITDYTYTAVPGCYTLLSRLALEASGIYQVQNQPALDLRGRGVLLGFVDTGIDYTSSSFQNTDGSSRILRIWDQTIRTGTPPELYPYGAVFGRDEINAALRAENPYEIVPERDENGHGTFLAKIAAGSVDENSEFTGAAPLCEIAVVKLKPAKQYLRDFYLIAASAEVYEETDIMAGVAYLNTLSEELGLPLVICLGIGTNMGNHGGEEPLSELLNDVAARNRRVIVSAAGNEAVERHHYYGSVTREQPVNYVEINVEDGVEGFTAECWARAPELYSAAVISPTGEKLPPTSGHGGGHQEYTFLFENTTISIDYRTVGAASANELIFFRFDRPVRGIWTIEMRAETILDGHYHIWLPMTEFLAGSVFFVQSNPDVTITNPSNAANVITVGAYDARGGSLYLKSGRGYSFTGTVKPELVAPGVDVTAPGNRGIMISETGTSIASSITAGASALLLELNLKRSPEVEINTAVVKNLLERGADRSIDRLYPDHAWGYGKLDLYGALESMRDFSVNT